MPFVYNMDPALFRIGSFEIRYYGLVYVLAFVVLYFYFRWLIANKKISLTIDDVYDLVFYNLLGVFIGSRLFHCLVWEPSYYLANPLKILYFWEGGMAYHGGLIGVALATWLFWRREEIRSKISFARLADILSFPAVFALALGRIANFINGELPGTVTNVSWCVYFPRYEGCRHPQQIYAAIKRFIILGIMFFINRKKNKEGFIFWVMVTLFGIGRVLIDFVRDDPRWLGLTLGQYLSFAMFVTGVIVLVKHYRRDIKRVFA
jgi:phosphatidylglycerol---prolipoprotein diacylglyceryl transferase